jgi:transposase
MGRSTRLHPDQAWRQLREEGQHLFAMQPLCQQSGARLVDAVCLKHTFRQIQSNRSDRHCKRSPSRFGPIGIIAASRCGGVHIIKLAREIRAMPSAVRLREDYSAEALRALARRSKDANQSRRLLSLAAVRDGMDRGSAAKIGGMDRQTLRDWVHRFNGSGPEGLIDNWTEGPKPRLSAEQLARFAQIVEAGPDHEKNGVVRWRRIDLKRVIAERFGVEFHPRYVGKLLQKLGFSHISARPRHPAQDERIVEAFKKTSRTR